MNALTGTWDVSLRTPIGTLTVQYLFEETPDGLRGTARGRDETVKLRGLATGPADGGIRATWSRRVTRPLRLDLGFDVVVTGDELTGHSRAGRLPRTRVTGRRVAA
ncbi:hypothetical protein AB0910_05755 [Streptomyces sp. NPDC047002]|uniref:hypothetical protein n=1 Tax=Streptomyces sp. NPDC047002 TaxID=3155475 RepID=UPI003454259B